MSGQLGLFGKGDRSRSIDEKFAEFDRNNKWVWEAFVERTFELINMGLDHCSADHVLHVVRFFHARKTKSMDGYRLNNNFSSRYSRKWARKFPEHKDFFRQRELKS